MSVNIRIIKLMLISVLAVLLVSCGGGSGSDSTSNSSSATMNSGVAQKGPFSVGSNISITKLDSSGIAISEKIESKITSKNGKFHYETSDIDSTNYYRLEATGKFFDENSGSVSNDALTLSAITHNPQNSSINVLTHWISFRVDALLDAGQSLDSSLEQSRNELFKLFGISHSDVLDITTNSISLDDRQRFFS